MALPRQIPWGGYGGGYSSMSPGVIARSEATKQSKYTEIASATLGILPRNDDFFGYTNFPL